MIKKLLAHFSAQGYVFNCYYDEPSDPDYRGTEPDKAYEALMACDCMNLRVEDPNTDFSIGWCLIIPELDPDEQIADHSSTGTVAEWIDAQFRN